jgi:beta-catenin-like protein 1
MGLGTIFSLLMKKGAKQYKKTYPAFSQKEEDEHVVSIIASLFKCTTDVSIIVRLNSKFIEFDYEKLRKLIE